MSIIVADFSCCTNTESTSQQNLVLSDRLREKLLVVEIPIDETSCHTMSDLFEFVTCVIHSSENKCWLKIRLSAFGRSTLRRKSLCISHCPLGISIGTCAFMHDRKATRQTNWLKPSPGCVNISFPTFSAFHKMQLKVSRKLKPVQTMHLLSDST